MDCIMGENCNCIFNRTGQCQDKPKPEHIPCLGEVCFNITTK